MWNNYIIPCSLLYFARVTWLFNVKLITELVDNSKKLTRNIKESLCYLRRTSDAIKKNSGIKQGMRATKINNCWHGIECKSDAAVQYRSPSTSSRPENKSPNTESGSPYTAVISPFLRKYSISVEADQTSDWGRQMRLTDINSENESQNITGYNSTSKYISCSVNSVFFRRWHYN